MSETRGGPLVRAGNFFFHFRNGLFPLLMAGLLALARPTGALSLGASGRAWLIAGALIAILGEAIRMGTIGLRYIERGGRNRRVYASRLVTGGIYRHTRNPMYVGNILIVVGLAMFSGSAAAFLFAVPFFLFVYRAIVAAEEDYLRANFGAEFDAYVGQVNRFLPSLKGWALTKSEVAFEWKRSLRKDYGNALVLALSLIILPVWRAHFLGTLNDASGTVRRCLWQSAIAVGVYLFIRVLKKTDRLADTAQPAESAQTSRV